MLYAAGYLALDASTYECICVILGIVDEWERPNCIPAKRPIYWGTVLQNILLSCSPAKELRSPTIYIGLLLMHI